jgi:DNA-directed RNA polymerase specialized sigma24 family protein
MAAPWGAAQWRGAGHSPFTRAFAHWNTVGDHPNPRAWVLRVAWNYYRSSWRKWESRWSADPAGPAPLTREPSLDPDLMAAIRGLPRGQREVLVLVALAELTPTQVARVLAKPAGTVRSQLFHARAALHQTLNDGSAPRKRDD